MYRIVACDMDETFIGRDHLVNPGNYRAVRLMREAGVKFVVATGRPFYSVLGTLAALGTRDAPDEYTITFNGGYVCANDGTPLASHTLTVAQAQDLYDFGSELGLCQHIYLLDRTLVANITDYEKSYLNGRMEVEDLPAEDLAALDEPIYKLLYHSDDFAYLHDVKDRMDAELPDLMAGLEVSFSAERYLEFNPKGVDKGTGLADVANYLGVPMAETIGVGDSANDLAMLLDAGLGLAVANVSETIRDRVSTVLKSECEDAALMEVYERFIAPDIA